MVHHFVKPNNLAKISNWILLRFLRYITYVVEVAQRIQQIPLHFSVTKDVESDNFLLKKLHVSEKINVSIMNILFDLFRKPFHRVFIRFLIK